jgi:antitoxin HicB
MKYHFRIHRDGRGYWAEGVELPGCSTQAESMTALRKNMAEALNLYLDESPEFDGDLPAPRKRVTGKFIEAVSVEPRVALAVQLRQIRKRRGITQKQAAQMLGFKGLYSYQRLESPKTANPEWATVVRIKRVFPEMCLDDLAA